MNLVSSIRAQVLYFQKQSERFLAVVLTWSGMRRWMPGWIKYQKGHINIWKYALCELQKGPQCLLLRNIRSFLSYKKRPNMVSGWVPGFVVVDSNGTFILGKYVEEEASISYQKYTWWAPKGPKLLPPEKRILEIVVDLNGPSSVWAKLVTAFLVDYQLL